MADRRNLIFPLIFLLWLFLSPDPRPPGAQLAAQKHIHDVIAREQHSLQVLQNSSYGDVLLQPQDRESRLNLTGFEADRGYAWDALPSVKERVGQHLQYALGDWGLQALEYGDDGENSPPLYKNITGRIFGRWVRSKVQPPVPQLNLSSYAPQGPFGPLKPRQFNKNVTSQEGEVSLEFFERPEPDPVQFQIPGLANATRINAEFKLESDDGEHDWSIMTRGVYFHDVGQAYLTTTSHKFDGVFMLPQLALSRRTFEEAKAVMNSSLLRTIQYQIDGRIDSSNPWSPTIDENSEFQSPYPACELVIFVQQLQPSWQAQPYSTTFLSFLERELRFPTGAFLPKAPNMHFSLLAFSPDCGYVLESKGEPEYAPQQGGTHLGGTKIQVLHNRSRHHLIIFSASLALQLAVLINQIRDACTPSTRSKISFYTIAMLALGDGFCTMSFCVTSLFVTSVWVNLISTAFISFLSVSFFGMRFLMDIWAVQAPERARREPDRPVTTQDRPLAMPGGLPLPVTSATPNRQDTAPVFMPSDQEGLEPIDLGATAALPTNTNNPQTELRIQSFGSLYTRFYLLLLGTLFLSLNASAWPSPARRLYFTALGMAYLSFWLPQIYRNVQRNCRKALLRQFVFGQSILRFVPFAYFFGYEANVLFAEVNYRGLALLAGWVWIQVLVLISQDIIGPRWFVKKDWAPPAYDYHPILRLDEEGSTLPLGASQVSAPTVTASSPTQERRRSSVAEPSSPLDRRTSSAKETKERGKRVFDCAICMQDLEVPVIEVDGRTSDGNASSPASLLARRNYMVTPCRHIFHSSCLEGWMKYRLQCPNCREGLPPL
ncbi:hypothetical protein K431DRAFT_273761 [Polychaeton citri CBS 116435]|uniref:DSC E3 ubiquitin ligase complex subunit A n=1 Tax=Polychaeton citri CBS 116435 TaxID=1314669 RepID=A0A9P4Q3X0_9PEZI|nr:hypothetical protein K431DRAFT_273761 [Polychaeton citri CBS 116435]